ncbi:MAG: HTTM domain-containing protein [Candidatus Obscuribacterales bacterium]|nr:HTTM domain-containing protein [Candidatus Obscuribacterales bacterium]
MAPHFLFFYGVDGLGAGATVSKHYWHGRTHFDLLALLPQHDAFVVGFYLVLMLSTLALIAGFKTRYASIVVFLGLLTLHSHYPYNQNGGDLFLRLSAFFVMMSPAGAMLSVDRMICKDHDPTPPLCEPWAQRMLQVQLTLAYCVTFWYKVTGLQWINGIAIYYASRLDDMMNMPVPFILDNLSCIKALTWSTLVIELLLWTLIWVPSRRVRYPVLVLGVLLHVGIDWTIYLPVFEWIFMAAYILFLYPEDLSKIVDSLKRWVDKRIQSSRRTNSWLPGTASLQQSVGAGELNSRTTRTW